MQQLSDFFSTLTTVGEAATNIVSDPCLLQVAQLVNQLHTGGAPSADGTPSGDGQPGIGLCSAVAPLEAVVWVSQNKWVFAVGALAVVGLFVGVGYKLGRRSSRMMKT